MGAGRGGGLLFLAVLLFVVYLVLTGVAGLLRWLAAVALLAAIVVFGVNVLRRR